jgi:hypothetical protein
MTSTHREQQPIRPELLDTLIAITEAEERAKNNAASQISEMALSLGAALRLPKSRLEQLYCAALIHKAVDVGDATDGNDGLQVEDKQATRQRVEEGERIAALVPYLEGSREILRHHHEHFNGKGFPDGLRAEEIPLEARILLFAEVWEKLTSPGRYRRPLLAEEVLDRLGPISGSQLDPQIVCFLRSNEGKWITEGPSRPNAPSNRQPRSFARKAAGRLRGHLLSIRSAMSSRKAAAARRGGYKAKAMIAVAATLGVLIFGSGLTFASQGAVPGDPLYGAKRAIEDVRLLLTPHSGEAGLHLAFARERLSEVETLIDEERPVPDTLLADLTHETQVLAAFLGESDGEQGLELAQQLRSHGQRATSVLTTLSDLTGPSSGALTDALAAVAIAEYAGAVAIAEHRPDGKGRPEEFGAPGPPSHSGVLDNAGPPSDSGAPDDAGPPSDSGAPEEAPGSSGDAPGIEKRE